MIPDLSSRIARVVAGVALAGGVVSATGDSTTPPADRGEYVFRAAGCASCHTDVSGKGAFLAGGRRFDTPFGVFYSPNITSDPTHGIGGWTEAQFVRAMRKGIGPGLKFYYPVFPYPSYTGITDPDLAALFAYLKSTPPVAEPDREHDLPWYMGFRIANWFWNLLFLDTGPYEPDPDRSGKWNRGAYLVTAMSHCAECHTPRNRFGALDRSRWMAGAAIGNDESAPNITPSKEKGIGNWPREELVDFLATGKVTGGYGGPEFIGGAMAEVIDDGLRYLREEDLDAMVEYLFSLPPLVSE